MLHPIKTFLQKSGQYLSVIAAGVFLLAGCDLNSGDQEFTGDISVYELQAVGNSGVSGTVTFEEQEDGSAVLTIELTGTGAGAEHPAHIHANTVVEGGSIDIHLNPVDGSSGVSETLVNALEDGTPVTYNQLIAYDGHIMVHQSTEDIATILTRGDIGGNALTGESTTYEMHGANESGVNGNARFEERNNGNTLVTIELSGTPGGGIHPAHIHNNSVAEGGGIAVPLNNVDGSSGTSATNIRAAQASNLTYSALLMFDGHVNVHQSEEDLTVIAQGNIGANEGGDQGDGNDDGNGNGY